MKSYDPVLREAMVEIKEVLKKHDIGGFVALNSATHGEFELAVDVPSWSVIRFLREGEAVHMKLYAKSRHKDTENSVAMLAGLRDLCALGFQQTDQMMIKVEQHLKVEHLPLAGRITNEDRR